MWKRNVTNCANICHIIYSTCLYRCSSSRAPPFRQSPGFSVSRHFDASIDAGLSGPAVSTVFFGVYPVGNSKFTSRTLNWPIPISTMTLFLSIFRVDSGHRLNHLRSGSSHDAELLKWMSLFTPTLVTLVSAPTNAHFSCFGNDFILLISTSSLQCVCNWCQPFIIINSLRRVFMHSSFA